MRYLTSPTLLFFLILLCAFFALPDVSSAAIARDNYATSSTTGTEITKAMAVSGSDRGLVVTLGTSASSGADIVNGVSYNGVMMTKVNTEKTSADSFRLYSYYLSAPATGTNDIVASTSASGSIYLKAVSYTGVSQTGQPEANSATASPGNAGSLDNTITTTVDNSIHVVAFFDNSCRTSTSVSNATLIDADYFACGTSAIGGLYESNPLLISPAASHTMTMSITPNAQIVSVGLILAPATAASLQAQIVGLVRAFWLW